MKNNNILTYFLTNTLFLGGGLSVIFKYAKNDSYIAIILGTMLGIGFLYIIHKYIINKQINIFLKVLYFLYIIIISAIILTSISTFISSYYLTKTPALISCIPLIALAIYASKSIVKISYLAIPLFFLSISIILFKSSILAPEIDINYVFPILNTNIYDIFKSTFIYAIISTTPSFLLINEQVAFKESLKYYLISSLLLIMTSFILITSLGGLVNTLSYPEYSVLRKIKVLSFIENIEGILAITWIFDIFITLSIISYKLKKLFSTKNNVVPIIILSILIILINFFVSKNYYNLIIIYNYHILILIITTIILSLFLSIIKKTSD